MASLGLFGSAAPRIRRLQPGANRFAPTLEELRAQAMTSAPSTEAEAAAAAVRGKVRLGAFGHGPDERPAAAPTPMPVPSKPKDDGGIFRNVGYRPEETGQNFGEWLFSDREDVQRARAEKAAIAANAAAREQQASQLHALRQAGYGEDQIVAFMNNPEKWSESLATNLEAANISGGDSRLVNGKLITAPKLGESDGYFYNQSPDGVNVQGQRPPSYAEQAAADKAKQPGIYNTGQAIVSVQPDGSQPRVLYRDPPGAGAGGAAGRFTTLPPEEVARRGYAKGTVVQVDERGKEYVNARPSTAQTGQPTEAERAGALHSQVALNGLGKVMSMEKGGYNRAGVMEQMGGVFGGENERLYDQGASEFIDGYLRAMTGAAATQTEIDTYKKQWFPQWGDTPPVIKQKAQGRLNALKAMKSKAGRSWNAAWDSSIDDLAKQLGDTSANNGAVMDYQSPAAADQSMSADEMDELQRLRAEFGVQ